MFFWALVFSHPKAVTAVKSGLDQPLRANQRAMVISRVKQRAMVGSRGKQRVIINPSHTGISQIARYLQTI